MPTELRAIIVDDEPSARVGLRKLLVEHPYIHVVAEAAEVSDALEKINLHKPNLIFLDIELRGSNGFDLLPQLEDLPAIIFVTGFGHYAQRAFEVNAIDFLTKPIDPDRLWHALERLYHPPLHLMIGPYTENDLICLSEGKKMRFAYATEISCIEVAGNYTDVYLASGLVVCTRHTLLTWANALPFPPFVAAYRSLILNIRTVRAITLNARSNIVLDIKGRPSPKTLGRYATRKLRQILKGLESGLIVP